MMHKKGVTINFAGQEIFLESAMIGGIVDQDENEMVAFYCGKREIGDFGVTVLQAMRGAFKTAKQEFGLSNQTAAEFMTYTIEEAIKREVKYGHLSETTFRKIQK
jgi:hypothetical protein